MSRFKEILIAQALNVVIITDCVWHLQLGQFNTNIDNKVGPIKWTS